MRQFLQSIIIVGVHITSWYIVSLFIKSCVQLSLKHVRLSVGSPPKYCHHIHVPYLSVCMEDKVHQAMIKPLYCTTGESCLHQPKRLKIVDTGHY